MNINNMTNNIVAFLLFIWLKTFLSQKNLAATKVTVKQLFYKSRDRNVKLSWQPLKVLNKFCKNHRGRQGGKRFCLQNS